MEVTNCAFCNTINASETNLFNDDEIQDIIKGVFSGKINIDNLDEKTYKKTASKLTDGVYKGYGKDMIGVQFGTPDHKMLSSLRENVYVFSAAKTYQQTKELSNLLYKDDKLVPFNEFKKEAGKVLDTYNKHYLSAEYNSAIAQGRSASMWQDFEAQKDIYNQLQYETIGDARVRDAHKVLDGIIRPIDDKFWSIYMPPNGWNCRCTVLQTFGETNTDLSKKAAPSKKEVPEIFRFNAGKDKIIFSKQHPFFEVPKEDKKLALKNFNLPLPKEAVVDGFKPAKTLQEAEERLRGFGIKEVDLKGLKLDTANAVVEACHKEAGYGNFSLDGVKTFRSSGNNGKALYSPSQNVIHINLSHIKAERQILLSYEEQIIQNQGTIQKYRDEYLGNSKYNPSTVIARMNSVRGRIYDIEQKIKRGEKARYWTVSSKFESNAESLHATIIHELGHYRHYKTLKETNSFHFNKAASISEYGRTNPKEYFAEWFAQYRLNGSEGVPQDILGLFKTIENGK